MSGSDAASDVKGAATALLRAARGECGVCYVGGAEHVVVRREHLQLLLAAIARLRGGAQV